MRPTSRKLFEGLVAHRLAALAALIRRKKLHIRFQAAGFRKGLSIERLMLLPQIEL